MNISPPLAALTMLDLAVVVAYGLLVIWITFRARSRTHNVDDYLVGGRSMPWFAVGMSWVATSFSALALLSFTGLGYKQGLVWIQMWIGELPALAVLLLVFLPFYRRLKVTTAYEYLGIRFGTTTRRFASIVFHFMALARAGLMLFLTSLTLSTFTGWSVDLCIVAVGLLAITYSVTGGLHAVIWTDVVQFACIVIGVGCSIIVVLQSLPGGFGDVAAAAKSLAETRPVIDFNGDPGAWPTMFTALIAYSVFALSNFGTNQQLVQRYVSCRDLSSTRRAVIVGWIAGLVVGLLTVGLGVALFALYGPEHAHQDKIFGVFIADRLPSGVAGVMVAAIFAATMSSVDSAVHSLATATLVDFIEAGKKPGTTVAGTAQEAKRLRLVRRITLFYGGMAIVAAFWAKTHQTNVFSELLKWLGFLAGPLLAVFLLGMFTRRVRQVDALLGMAAGYLAVFLFVATPLSRWLVPLPEGSGGLAGTWGFHGIWAASFGALAAFCVAVVASMVVRSTPNDSV